MRVAIIGASGFVGRHTVKSCVAAGHAVRAVARNPPAPADRVTPFAGDATDPDLLARAASGCDAIINLVGINHEKGAQTYERMHVILAHSLAVAAQKAGVGRLVHLSVMCARSDPSEPYHDTKHRGDEAIRASGVPFVILRPSIIYGEDDAFTTKLASQLRYGVAPLPAGGRAFHAPVHVDDVAEACVRALVIETTDRTLPLSGSRTLMYREIVDALATRAGRHPLRISMPESMMRMAAGLTSWLADPPITRAQVTMVVEGMADDTAESWAALGMTARGFPEGLG